MARTLDLVRHGVTVSRLTRGRDEDIQFVLAAYRKSNKRGDFFRDMDLRADGPLITKDRLKVLGLRSNVKLTAAFFDILNMEGRKDPIEAAGTIVRCVNVAVGTARDIANHIKLWGDEGWAELIPSPAFFGPCCHATALGGKRMPIGSAPLLPLSACEHPGQCGFDYRLSTD